jgi:hypothetical protein
MHDDASRPHLKAEKAKTVTPSQAEDRDKSVINGTRLAEQGQHTDRHIGNEKQ